MLTAWSSGVDLVEVARVARLARENPIALAGLLTERERGWWRGTRQQARVLACKEAVLKAGDGPGADEVEFHDLEIEPVGATLHLHWHGALRAHPMAAAAWHVTSGVDGGLAVAWALCRRAQGVHGAFPVD
ncbi:MAG: 4'-phosphopantetheinyl transferase superfamily protein [Terriglobales bacterium]